MKKYAFNPGMLRFGIPPKILLIMRLIIVLLTTAILQVSANTYGQQVTLNEKNVPLTTVFKEIRKQTGYDFLYSDKMMDDAKKVTIQLKNVTLEAALELAFKNQQLSYTIENKMVTVKQKKESFLDDIVARFQNIDVRGRVVDSLGHGLSGATVKVKGGKSVLTNADGSFFIGEVDKDAVLLISYIGYKTLEIRVKMELGDVKLMLELGNLQEVVINKGYYSTQGELNTGSVSIISGDVIRQQPVSDPLVGLAGRLTGVYVSQNSAVPGASVNFNIRGKNSIGAGLDPLYVIDGVPYPSQSLSQVANAASVGISPFSNIRPEDIENIVILKDADATAIYGSRGANGVVLITTRRGRAGKTQLDINSYYGAGGVTRMQKLMNTEQYIAMRKEAQKNDNAPPSALQYDINGRWDQTRYTDWEKLIIGGTSKMTNFNATLSGGNENMQFLLGGSYRNEKTVFPGDFDNSIAGINANVNYTSVNKKLKINFSSSYSNNDNNLPLVDLTQYIFLLQVLLQYIIRRENSTLRTIPLIIHLPFC